MTERLPVVVSVNGRGVELLVEPRATLADLLRDECACLSVHLGCEQGACGACTVLVDGEQARACLVLGVQANGADVVTLEGLAPPAGWHVLQEAFRDAHSFQCGFCTPGFVLAAYAFLAERPDADEREIREALSGNLCRCTGYQSIVAGVVLARDRLDGRALPAPGRALS